jgi:UDP-N-acetylglucosamine--N-acetylmuramyl-(pentapeptide) pyrophosphoryl-undecaprenol N-acetylglucosamine transferase
MSVAASMEHPTGVRQTGTGTRTIALAGGGSGGHLSPGLAIAERLLEVDPRSRPLFLCSERAIDAAMLGDAGADFRPVPAAPLRWSPRGLWRCARAYWRGRSLSRRILREERVEHVVSLGGFVTGPVTAAARSLGIPITLLNLDATPGTANRVVARRARRVLSAVETPGHPQFAEAIVGMPIRRSALAPAGRAECRARLGIPPTSPVLLVTGASQGAGSLNRFMLEFARRHRDLLASWHVLHLAGPQGEPGSEALAAGYRDAGIAATVVPFMNRMGLAWGAAELAVSRAGANSVAEAEANRVPTVFVPYPYHRDLHQAANAAPLVAAGAAALAYDRIEPAANMESIGSVLEPLVAEGARRDAMEAALAARGDVDAALAIARTLLR